MWDRCQSCDQHVEVRPSDCLVTDVPARSEHDRDVPDNPATTSESTSTSVPSSSTTFGTCAERAAAETFMFIDSVAAGAAGSLEADR